MSALSLLSEMKKHLPIRVYGKGPVLELLREMGQSVNKKTPLQVVDVYRDTESGELVCYISSDGNEKVTAALANLKPDITHPLFNQIRNYRRDVEEDMSKPVVDVNSSSFRIGNLYKK